MNAVLSPADPLPAPPFRLGGRVVEVGEGFLLIADAFALRKVHAHTQAKPGALVVAHVARVEGDACHADAVEVFAGREVPDGEAARLRTRGTNLRRRAELLSVVRRFFASRGYLEVETPIAVPSPGLDVHLDAITADARFLITSPEYQMKRLLVGGMPRIFQITKCFRRGELGARHNPEFSMVEWYRAFSGVDAMIAETEALIVEVVRAARGSSDVRVGDRLVSVVPPFERLPIATAFARHAGVTEAQALALALSGRADDEERFFRLFVDAVEPALAEGPPVVLVDWPSSQASLARKKPGDPRVAERFEVMIAGVELCNGFGELVDPNEQRARFAHDQDERRARGLPVYPIDERFVEALEEGMPESSGNALGLDRLIALSLGVGAIADVLAFPDGWL